MHSLINFSLALSMAFTTALPAYAGKPPVPNKPPAKLQRPPQYVMIGFDGGLNLTQWSAMRSFVTSMKKVKKPVNFTYFVSGVYFLSDNNRHMYSPPKHTQGYSMIGFGEDKPQSIADRVDMMNAVYKDGQEIASHANGHFDASEDKWDANDWSAEFKQYDDLLFGAFFNNKIQPNVTNKYPKGYAFDSKEIIGFRAPYLGTTPDLYPTLKAYGFKYDVSSTGEPQFWPRKDEYGIWRFLVPSIEIAGTGKKVLSMDYNFYVAQSKGADDLANREAYRKQMVDSYMNYFNNNYYGHRAPVFIGHHFNLYNGGAYWDALQDFTKNVCGQPEVKCINYKQYAAWIESLKPETLLAYRNGQFDQLARPKGLEYETARPLDVQVRLEKIGDQLEITASGADYSSERMNLVVMVNDQAVPLKTSLSLGLLRHQFPVGSTLKISASLRNAKRMEIQSDTHLIKNLGTSAEEFVQTPLETRLILGDLPEAHEWH